MSAELWARVEHALGAGVVSRVPVTGGDINSAWRVTLSQGPGRTVFVKTNAQPPKDMFAAEARGLKFLSHAQALRTPAVLAVANDFLALEWIQSVGRGRDFDEQLGRGLAKLHRDGVDTFGLAHNNFIGRLPQDNRAVGSNTWADFYSDRRLRPQITMAALTGALPAAIVLRLETLCASLPQRLGPAEPPARLHGDLWGGNHLSDERGLPVLIDPAVYAGHREVDLAMMKLFGGFSERAFSAYEEVFPLASGHLQRVPLYHLYYLLVHVNLFGGGYVNSVANILTDLRA